MRIRAAIAGDEEALSTLAMRSKAHWGYDAEFMAACRPALTVRHTRDAFVAVGSDDAILGFYQMDGAELSMMFVEPSQIGRGIGCALFKHMSSHATGPITILSDPYAEAFYLEMGAKRVGEAASDVFGPARPLPLLRFER